MIQEHWLFENQLHLIGEIDKEIYYAAKGVDKYDPLPPKYLPRGYGGVAIIWKKDIDHLVKPLEDGRERIQAIEVNSNNIHKLLLVSVCMPATGSMEHQEEFYDTIDQLYEIWQKFHSSHQIIIGGDLNEDLNNQDKDTKRKKYLLKFIMDCGLTFTCSEKTFVKTNGEECSELDYFLQSNYKESSKTILSSL